MNFKRITGKILHSEVIKYIVSQWFFIGLGIFILLAKRFPNFARNGGDIHAEYTIEYGAVACIFFQSGLSMSTRKLMINMLNWRTHLVILIISFSITGSIVYGFCCWIRSLNKINIDSWVLMGLILTGTSPTTISSNVVMTVKSGGNDLLSLCEVFISNILGTFITPALVQLYTSSGPFSFGNPAKDSSVSKLYANVFKKIGLSLFLPLVVGQALQNIFPDQVSWTLAKFKLKNVGPFCLLLIMFSSFSTAFYQKAFESVSRNAMIFLMFSNIVLYLLFTAISYAMARPCIIKKIFLDRPTKSTSRLYQLSYRFFKPFYYDKRDTIAIVFCGASKTAGLGVPLITSQYGDNFQNLGKLLVPLVLYQSEQVLVSNLLVPIFKKWSFDEEKAASIEQSNAVVITS